MPDLHDHGSCPPQRLLVSGATGMIGRRLVAACRAAGDTVVSLTRGGTATKLGENTIVWDAGETPLDPALVSGFDAVVHLAGEPIAGRWTAAKKQRILQSRVRGTAALARALALAAQPPKSFLCASGINFYGHHGEPVSEGAPPGKGFLTHVAQAWEQASEPAAAVSRVVHMRIGMVLAPKGGALHAMLPLFRLGLGGRLGSGKAFMSWITLTDAVRAMRYLLNSLHLSGPVNLVTPNPVTNREFTKTLAEVLHRPAALPVPAWLLRLAIGELAEESVLGSLRVLPERLLAEGFQFAQPDVRSALESLHL